MNLDSTLAPKRVLIVDDNRDSASMLSMLLLSYGHAVEEAYDGPAALAIAAEFLPDIVFLDLVMPGMDGYAVEHQLRKQERTTSRKSVIIALSAFGQVAYREATAEQGFDGHLQKPLATDQLLCILGTGQAPAGSNHKALRDPLPASPREAHAVLWQRQLTSAREAWPELSDEELLATEGKPEPLADIVQKRYAISRKSADAQVAGFLRQHGMAPFMPRS
jgi:CheY-like chemotaxis protein